MKLFWKWIASTAVVAAFALIGETSSSAQTSSQLTAAAPASMSVDTAIVRTSAPVFLLPDATREPLRVAKEGSTLRLLQQQGDWCNVEFEDPQYGRRAGYIQTKFIRITSGRLDPMDLSVPEVSQPQQQPGVSSPPDANISSTQVPPPGLFPRPVKSGISKARKVTGSILLGLGGYYFLSAAIADSINMGEYRDTWTVLGVGTTTAGAIVLATGRDNAAAPALTFGPHRLAAVWRISR